jgi:hypothetical protein
MTAGPDLTRWNRTGLGRFAYVDGNAATFLEELRVQMLTRYARGATPELRDPAFWRDLYLRDPATWPDPAASAALRSRLAWAALLPDPPGERETPARRNGRLVDQYDARSGDYTAEIMRAFARAAHVLMGHVDAYANEGYLRTATQWESLRRLAAMVGYQPTPAASASTLVALIAAEGGGQTDVDRGIAMKYAPPEGGRPVIFETIRPLTVHPALNALRARDADRNATTLDPTILGRWLLPKGTVLSPGDLVVLATDETSAAATIAEVTADAAAGIATLRLEGELVGPWPRWRTRLLTGPAAILAGAPRPSAGSLVVESPLASRFAAGEIVRLTDATGKTVLASVAEATGGHVGFNTSEALTGAVTILGLTPYQPSGGGFIEAAPDVAKLYFNVGGTIRDVALASTRIGAGEAARSGQRTAAADATGAVIAHRFAVPAGSSGLGYAIGAASVSVPGQVVAQPPPVTAALADASATVTFRGRPPKDLAIGDRFAARAGTALKPLRVLGLRTEADRFHIQFDRSPGTGPLADIEFHGPMRRELRPELHDRGQGPAVAAGASVTFAGLPAAAAALLIPGRQILIEDARRDQRGAAIATIRATTPGDDGSLTVGFAEGDETFAGFVAGWTLFHANAVTASHGESLGSKVLGSGNGELSRQIFNLPVAEISFVPSSAAEAGIVPDLEVTVAGRIWQPRDLTDLDADGTESWSPVLRDDGTLDLCFRRRLVTGTDNVLVTRHRVGSGPRGNRVPPYSFAKPVNQSAVIAAIVQPMESSGGADRESPADIRANAAARLAANDRAVALGDFARLARRHASIWQARADAVMGVGRQQLVRLTVVPADGAAVTPALGATLGDFLLAKALPSTRIELVPYEPLPIRITTRIRVDTSRHVPAKVQDAAVATLLRAFSLRQRRLGQPLFIGEILAALETVEGAETALATFALAPTAATPERSTASSAGGFSALFPKPGQVAFLAAATDIAITMEAAT